MKSLLLVLTSLIAISASAQSSAPAAPAGSEVMNCSVSDQNGNPVTVTYGDLSGEYPVSVISIKATSGGYYSFLAAGDAGELDFYWESSQNELVVQLMSNSHYPWHFPFMSKLLETKKLEINAAGKVQGNIDLNALQAGYSMKCSN